MSDMHLITDRVQTITHSDGLLVIGGPDCTPSQWQEALEALGHQDTVIDMADLMFPVSGHLIAWIANQPGGTA